MDQSEASMEGTGQSEAGDKSLELRVFMAEIFLPFKDTVGVFGILSLKLNKILILHGSRL